MKKVIFLLPLLALLYPLLAAPAAAQSSCTWRQNYGVASVCSNTNEKSARTSCCDAANRPFPTGNMNPECCCESGSSCLDPTPAPAAPKFIMPEFQIKIPGLTLSPTSTIVKDLQADGSYRLEVPWIAEYIKGVYDYGLSIAGILAAIVLMAGGVLWLMSGGDASKTTQAKELILGSVTGLVILMCSYVILIQINPALTKFGALTLSGLKRVQFDSVPAPANPGEFSARCKPQSSGECAVANMSIFGTLAEQASAICFAESSGNPKIHNSLTKCTGGEFAVWGLFQFNLSDNNFTDENNNLLKCHEAFNKAWTNKSPTCTVTDKDLYDKCVAAATNPKLSISNAYRLTKEAKTTWGPWEANSKWCNF